MITKVSNTISMLKSLWVEMFLNKTNKVSNIADGSVLSAVAYGTAKVAQKAIKDIAIVEAQIFPTTATGDYLDKSAALFGVSPRKEALGSSTYVRVFAQSGTIYTQGTNFIANNGIRFESSESYTVDDSGYGYISVRSTTTGYVTNVDANTITQVSPRPLGHIECTNEYCATGGRDYEDDETFRNRIINYNNKLSEQTTESFTQIFQDLDDRILKVINVGLGEDGKTHIYLVTQNGSLFTEDELNNLLQQITPYFGFTEINAQGDVVGIVLENAQWMYIGGDRGIDFRVELQSNYEVSAVRKNIQIALTKYLDFRFWEPGSKVEWDDLLSIVKNAEGVKYVPDEYFYPYFDEEVPLNQLPRIKGFIMRDLNGNILFDSNSNLSNIFYPTGDVDSQRIQGTVNVQQFLTSFIVTTIKNVAVPSAYITIGNNVIITDSNGQANILLENGTYSYTLTKTGWDTQQSSFVVLNNPIQININDFNATPYNVTFTIYEGNAPLLGAKISIQNQVLTTNSEGQATISLEPGTYSYTITMSGYTTINSAVTVQNQDISITERMFLEQINTFFSVIDRARSIYVPNVEIVVTDITKTTDEFGQATVPLLVGNYDVTAYKDGYQQFNGTAIVTGNEDENCVLIEMNATPYDIKFTVVDNETNQPIVGATIQVGDQTYLTNEAGIAIISLISGTYNYTVFKTSYMKVENTIVVSDKADSVIVQLQQAFYTFRLYIRDIENGNYLQGMEVFVNNRTIISNVNGMIETTLTNGIYEYVVRSKDYKEYRGQIEIKDQDLVETIYVQVRDSNLTFIVTDSLTKEPLPEANISISDVGTQIIVDQGVTDLIGKVVLNAEAGSYTYSVSKEYYYTTTDSVTVQKLIDQTINVELERKPGLKEINVREIIPNITSSSDIENGGTPVQTGFSVTVTNTQDNTSQIVTTDENGNVYPEIVFGIDYTISPTVLGFYQNETITHNWEASETDPVLLSLTCSKQIEFRVQQDITTIPLQGVSIIVTGLSSTQVVTTDENGNANVYVSPIQMNYSASLTYYNTITGNFIPTPSSTYIQIIMTFIQRQLTINVKASNPVQTSADNCPVVIQSSWSGTQDQQYKISGTTGTNGSFVTTGNSSGSIPPGTYTITVGGDNCNYNQSSQTITFPTTNVVNLTVTRKTLTVTINAKEKFGTTGTEHNFAAGIVLKPTYSNGTSSGNNITLTSTSSFQKTMYAGYAEKFEVVPSGFYSTGSLITVNWNSSTTINYPLVCTKIVPVYVKSDFYSTYLQGANVTFTGAGVSQTGTTNSGGYVNIYLVPLSMSYTISLSGYTTLTGSVTPQSSTTRLEYTLNIIRYPLTVIVTIQGSSNIPSGVPVKLINQYNTSIVYSGNTNTQGRISFSSMPPGNYNWSVAASQASYEEASGTIVIPANNNTLNVQIEYKTSNSTVVVRESIPGSTTSALSNITLSYTSSVGNGSISLNSSGSGSFVAVLGVTYTFTVPNSSFYSNGSQTHSFTAVNQTWTMTVTCSSQITINVKSNNYGTNISGASITYFNQSKTTDSSGNAVFYRSSLTKSYTVSKTNYTSISGNITTSTTSPLNLKLAETSSSITITLKDYYQNAQQANANGCPVTLKNTRLSSISYSGTTNSNGQVTFGPTIAGTYTLTWGGGTSYWQSGSATITMPTASYQNNAVRLTKSVTSTWYLRAPNLRTTNNTFKVNSLYKPVATTNGVATTVTLGGSSSAYNKFTYTYIAGIKTTINRQTTYFCTGTSTTNTPYTVTPTYNFNNIPTTYYCCAIKSIIVTVRSNRTSAGIQGATVVMKGIDGSTSGTTQTQKTNSSGQVTIYISGLTNSYTVSATDYVTKTQNSNSTSNFTIVLNYVTYTLTVNVKRSDNSAAAPSCLVKLSQNNSSVMYSGTTNTSGVWTVTVYKGTYYWETGGGSTWGSDITTGNYPEHYRGSSNTFTVSSNTSITIYAYYVSNWWEQKIKKSIQNDLIDNGESSNSFYHYWQLLANNDSLFQGYTVPFDSSKTEYILQSLQDITKNIEVESMYYFPGLNIISDSRTINGITCYLIGSMTVDLVLHQAGVCYYNTRTQFYQNSSVLSILNYNSIYGNRVCYNRDAIIFFHSTLNYIYGIESLSNNENFIFQIFSFNIVNDYIQTQKILQYNITDSNCINIQKLTDNLFVTFPENKSNKIKIIYTNLNEVKVINGDIKFTTSTNVNIGKGCVSKANDYQNDPVWMIIGFFQTGFHNKTEIKYFPNGLYDSSYNLKSYQTNPAGCEALYQSEEDDVLTNAPFVFINNSFTKVILAATNTSATGGVNIFPWFRYYQKKLNGVWEQVTDKSIIYGSTDLFNIFEDMKDTSYNPFNVGDISFSHTFTYRFDNSNVLYSYDLVWNE